MSLYIKILLFGFICHTSHAAERSNILLIYADDIGHEALNCYGGLDFETPNLNRKRPESLASFREYSG